MALACVSILSRLVLNGPHLIHIPLLVYETRHAAAKIGMRTSNGRMEDSDIAETINIQRRGGGYNRLLAHLEFSDVDALRFVLALYYNISPVFNDTSGKGSLMVLPHLPTVCQ